MQTKSVGPFTVALASSPAASRDDPRECDDDAASWPKLHRTLVLTATAQIEATGEPVETASDLDADGRPDLLLAFDELCTTRVSVETGDPDAPWRAALLPAAEGDFAVVLDRGDALVVAQSPSAYLGGGAWLYIEWTTHQGRTAVSASDVGNAGEMGPSVRASHVIGWNGTELVILDSLIP